MNRLLKVALLMSFLATTLLADGQMGSGGYQGCTGQNCPPCTVDCPPPCTEHCVRPQEQDYEDSVKVDIAANLHYENLYRAFLKDIFYKLY